MLGDIGTEQFEVTTRLDGKVIGTQKLHDPFMHHQVIVGMSRWDLLKAMFKHPFRMKVQVELSGTEGVMRAVMTLDPEALKRDTEEMLRFRALSREQADAEFHCFTTEATG